MSSARLLPSSVRSPIATTNVTPLLMNSWLIWLMTLTATELGFLPSGEVVHWVSEIMPNFQGAANADAAINITSISAQTVLKKNSFFICIPSFFIKHRTRDCDGRKKKDMDLFFKKK